MSLVCRMCHRCFVPLWFFKKSLSFYVFFLLHIYCIVMWRLFSCYCIFFSFLFFGVIWCILTRLPSSSFFYIYFQISFWLVKSLLFIYDFLLYIIIINLKSTIIWISDQYSRVSWWGSNSNSNSNNNSNSNSSNSHWYVFRYNCWLSTTNITWQASRLVPHAPCHLAEAARSVGRRRGLHCVRAGTHVTSRLVSFLSFSLYMKICDCEDLLVGVACTTTSPPCLDQLILLLGVFFSYYFLCECGCVRVGVKANFGAVLHVQTEQTDTYLTFGIW